MDNGRIVGIQKSNKKTLEYFVGVDASTNGNLFDTNPMHGFTTSDVKAANVLCQVLAAGDKRNQYSLYEVTINQIG